jgi:hypothetical protein
VRWWLACSCFRLGHIASHLADDVADLKWCSVECVFSLLQARRVLVIGIVLALLVAT